MLSFFKRKKIDPRARLLESLGRTELPALPLAMTSTLRLLRDRESTFVTIGRAIESDPALVVGVLKTVNSAAFGLRQQVDDASHAASLLGRSQLESLVVAFAVKKRLPAKPCPGFEPSIFWRASARRAAVARSLAEMFHPQTQGSSFVAGLLQDLALPLLCSTRPEEYGPLMAHCQADPDADLGALEYSELGFDHMEIGACVATGWEFPEALVESIGEHHSEESTDVGSAVQLAGLLREEAEPDMEPLVERCREQHGAAPDRVVARVGAALEQADELARLFV